MYSDGHSGRNERFRMVMTERGSKAFYQAVNMLKKDDDQTIEKAMAESFAMATTLIKVDIVPSLYAFREHGEQEEIGMVAYRFANDETPSPYLADAYEIWVLPELEATDDGGLLTHIPPFRMAIDVFHDLGYFVYHDFYAASLQLEWHRRRVRNAILNDRYKLTQ